MIRDRYKHKDNFIFTGFEPNRFLKAHCKEIYCLIEEKSPSDASKTILLSRAKSGFEGSIRIVSGSCTFLVNSSQSEPCLVVEDLYAQFNQKIFHWIRNRELGYQNNSADL